MTVWIIDETFLPAAVIAFDDVGWFIVGVFAAPGTANGGNQSANDHHASVVGDNPGLGGD